MGRSDGMVVYKKMSFLASLVWGVCSVIMVTVVCASGVVFYSLHIIDTNSQALPGFITQTFGDLPNAIKSIPILADALSDERRLDYVQSLDIKVDLTPDQHRGDGMRSVISVTNEGEEVVNWLSVRIVVRDYDGSIVDEHLQYVATPLSIDDDVPGPLRPGANRQITCGWFPSSERLEAAYEVTEVRVWVPNAWDHKDQQDAGSAASDDAMLSGAAVD